MDIKGKEEVTFAHSVNGMILDCGVEWLWNFGRFLAKELNRRFLKMGKVSGEKDVYKHSRDSFLKEFLTYQEHLLQKKVVKIASYDLELLQLRIQKFQCSTKIRSTIAEARLPILEEKEKEIIKECERINELHSQELLLAETLEEECRLARENYEEVGRLVVARQLSCSQLE